MLLAKFALVSGTQLRESLTLPADQEFSQEDWWGSKKEWKVNGQKVVTAPKLGVKKDTVTIAGFSSGGYKTTYIFNQAPERFQGAGILSGSIGGLYAIGQVKRRYLNSDYYAMRQKKVKEGKWPAPSAFKGKKVYVQAGTKDTVVLLKSTEMTANFFKKLVGDKNVQFKVYATPHMVPSIYSPWKCHEHIKTNFFSEGVSCRQCPAG